MFAAYIESTISLFNKTINIGSIDNSIVPLRVLSYKRENPFWLSSSMRFPAVDKVGLAVTNIGSSDELWSVSESIFGLLIEYMRPALYLIIRYLNKN